MASSTLKAAATPRMKFAINTVSKKLLRELVIDLCREIPGVAKKLEAELLTTEEEIERNYDFTDSEGGGSDSDTDDDDRDNGHRSKKAKENCDEEFDVLANTKESCRYHPNESYPDDDFFADDDENCHGPIDCLETREEYPEGFVYPCCDRKGDEEPCTVVSFC
ncbi:hypothetical protein AJ79_02986 [Helicocarpus griseus UAMH5409]|uniref:Uncharacterized protein n=1 Tax=Helicocarpus griseus UAMH5409 TaxID=1447875 RepID=A0A2B7Y0D2_9EURO|nr:hypothetical protein AJ79_02986 [Helicocarpus griseus UAMH5409]